MILALAAALAAAPTPSVAAPAAQKTCTQSVTADALVCRALEAQNKGDNAAAAQSFEDAARASSQQDPKTARMLAAAGNMWIAAGQPGRAALALDKALAMPGLEAEQRGEALLDRARAAEAQNDLKTARARLTEARATISEDPFYWYFSAALAIREGDVGTARTAITEALKIAPSDPTVLFEAGHVAHFAGDDVKARDYWQRSASADASGPIGKASRDALQMLSEPPRPVTKPVAKPK
jgi:tetratricopeptide (TPR) repeat protein